MNQKYFSQRPELKPIIYVYETPDAENRKGLLKIGYTTRNAKGRIKEQLGTAGLNYNILLEQEAIRSDGSTYDDHEIHRYLRRNGFANPDGFLEALFGIFFFIFLLFFNSFLISFSRLRTCN